MGAKKSPVKQPAVRVDGGKRIDLAELRRRRAVNAKTRREAPPVEDMRVSDVWERAEKRTAAAGRLEKEAKRVARAVKLDGLKDGSVLSEVRVKISRYRAEARIMRARPGTFEWAYGRNKHSMEFYAGSHFAQLWEQAGATVASSSNFLRGIKAGYGTGISEGRLRALDSLRGVKDALGQVGLERLVDYCVLGLTSGEIATKYATDLRAMKHVLAEDLKTCATHFGFLRQGRAPKDTRIISTSK